MGRTPRIFSMFASRKKEYSAWNVGFAQNISDIVTRPAADSMIRLPISSLIAPLNIKTLSY